MLHTSNRRPSRSISTMATRWAVRHRTQFDDQAAAADHSARSTNFCWSVVQGWPASWSVIAGQGVHGEVLRMRCSCVSFSCGLSVGADVCTVSATRWGVPLLSQISKTCAHVKKLTRRSVSGAGPLDFLPPPTAWCDWRRRLVRDRCGYFRWFSFSFITQDLSDIGEK
jgi:hypothetical protein